MLNQDPGLLSKDVFQPVGTPPQIQASTVPSIEGLDQRGYWELAALVVRYMHCIDKCIHEQVSLLLDL